MSFRQRNKIKKKESCDSRVTLEAKHIETLSEFKLQKINQKDNEKRLKYLEKELDKINLKNRQINLFYKELFNKSIIDFGCGEGHFLINIHNNFKHKKLLGIDIFIPD